MALSKKLLLLLLLIFFHNAAAESLLDAKHIAGNLQLFTYAIGDEDPASEGAYATSIGGILGYRYRWKNNFGVNLDYAGSNALGPSINAARLHLFNNDTHSIHLNTLARANIFYANKTSVARIGYQTLDTPLFNEDKTRIVPWGTESFTLSHIHENRVRTYLSIINRIRSNTSEVYKKESASGAIDSGLYIVAATYQPDDYHSLETYLYIAPDLYNSFYTQYQNNHPITDDIYLGFGIQYLKTFASGDSRNANINGINGGQDADVIATRVSFDYHDLETSLAYSQNFGQSGINKGYGGLTKLYTTSMVANGRKNFKPESWMLKADYQFTINEYGTSDIAIWLLNTQHHNTLGNDFTSYYTHLRHFLNVDTSLYIRYEYIDYEEALTDTDYLRIIMKYTF